jgi:hypothetical protein
VPVQWKDSRTWFRPDGILSEEVEHKSKQLDREGHDYFIDRPKIPGVVGIPIAYYEL